MSTQPFTTSHRVGVLMGGLSSEREISFKSGKAVSEALRSKGYTVVDIIVNRDIATVLQEANIDVAWVALHGLYGEDGCMQALLEIMQIPYTSAGVQACAVSMHKTSTKRMLRDTIVNLSKDVVWDSQRSFPSNWTAPLVIKDPLGGSSIGVWLCFSDEDLASAINECQTLGGEYLIEEYTKGIEITVTVFNEQTFPVITILPHGEFFDLKSKYTKGETTYLAPSTPQDVISTESMIPIHIAQDAQRQALAAYQRLNMKGVCRADFIVPCSGRHPSITIAPDARPVFLEVNAIPGMTATSLAPMAAKVLGLSFEDLTELALQSACLENS
jgi:D-alanine-D-alanine ligase